MNELKIQLSTLKSLAKELMKTGNISAYFTVLKEANSIENKLMLIKI